MADDDGAERQLREQLAVDRSLAKRAKATRRKYEKALTKLWVANGGGAVVTIGFLGSDAGRAASSWPLFFFLTGLVCLGLGMLFELASEWVNLHANQHATRLLGFRSEFAKSPLQRAGWSKWNASIALVAVIAFIGGCIVGLADLL